MAITFNTNLAALGAQRNIGIASNAASSSLAKLSSGSRVPQAKDDAAGLAIGSKLKSEVAGLTQASNNAAQAISLLQIADGALSTLGDILQRMKALAVQASSGQLDDASRSLLNQEFTNLQSEVDRVANVTNFNGTVLLAGSTKVQAKVNDVAASATSTSTNLIGQGFDSIDFSQDFGDGAVKIEYAATGNVLTVTDLANNKTQSITLDSGAIAVGDTETYNFGDIGVKIALNSNFDKTANIAGTDTATVTAGIGAFSAAVDDATLGVTGVTGTTIAINDISFDGVGADALQDSALDTQTITLGGAYNGVTFGNVTIGTHTFTTSDTVDTSTAGTTTVTYDDGKGNTFAIDVTTVGTGTAGTPAATITITQDAASSIEASGTGANAPSLVSVTESSTAGSEFNFGNVDATVVSIDATTASAAAASITLNGVAFTGTVDLTSTGVKTLSMADASGNSFDIQFNVTGAFVNGASVELDIAQLGQVVGADSVTSGSTTFNFKVGTGTTTNDRIQFSLNSATATSLGINSSSIDTAANADTAITALNSAITAVASRRADIGAAQSRLDFASASISVAIENTTAAASALLDVDVSAEITKFTNQNVLMQAGISLLSQANQQPALLLRLLQ